MRNSFNEMSFEELVLKRNELRKAIHDTRVKKMVGQLNNPLLLRTQRRQLSRVLSRIYNFDEKESKNKKESK